MARQRKKAIAKRVFQLKVTLIKVEPPIWRRLLVPADMSLGDFHFVLQDAMGWTNSHLHNFITDGQWNYNSVTGGTRYGDIRFDEEGDMEDEFSMTLAGILKQPGDQIAYVYDFGDNWTHDILLEEILSSVPDGGEVPSCPEGERACPPDDCGGISGYAELLDVLANPDHKEYQDMRSWVESMVDGKFDPEALDLKKVNRAIRQNRTRTLTERAMREYGV
jgi:hypothetical protein